MHLTYRQKMKCCVASSMRRRTRKVLLWWRSEESARVMSPISDNVSPTGQDSLRKIFLMSYQAKQSFFVTCTVHAVFRSIIWTSSEPWVHKVALNWYSALFLSENVSLFMPQKIKVHTFYLSLFVFGFFSVLLVLWLFLFLCPLFWSRS